MGCPVKKEYQGHILRTGNNTTHNALYITWGKTNTRQLEGLASRITRMSALSQETDEVENPPSNNNDKLARCLRYREL